MLGRRHAMLAYLLGSLLVLAASLHAPTAYSAAGDPPSGSPAGAVYQLPLEQGRSDAAPKGSGGTGAVPPGGGGGGSGSGGAGGAAEPSDSGSLYRTENNFGSSSHVPGVASTGNGSSGAGASGVAAGNGSGAGSAAIAGGAVAAETADTGNTSVTAGIVLIAAIVLLAITAGVLSRRFGGRARAS